MMNCPIFSNRQAFLVLLHDDVKSPEHNKPGILWSCREHKPNQTLISPFLCNTTILYDTAASSNSSIASRSEDLTPPHLHLADAVRRCWLVEIAGGQNEEAERPECVKFVYNRRIRWMLAGFWGVRGVYWPRRRVDSRRLASVVASTRRTTDCSVNGWRHRRHHARDCRKERNWKDNLLWNFALHQIRSTLEG